MKSWKSKNHKNVLWLSFRDNDDWFPNSIWIEVLLVRNWVYFVRDTFFPVFFLFFVLGAVFNQNWHERGTIIVGFNSLDLQNLALIWIKNSNWNFGCNDLSRCVACKNKKLVFNSTQSRHLVVMLMRNTAPKTWDLFVIHFGC